MKLRINCTLLIVIFTLLSCATREKGAIPSVPVEKTKPAESLSSPKAITPEGKWDEILKEAKKEGTVSAYTLWNPNIRNSLAQAFQDKYGITVEFTAFGRGAELIAKVQAEKRAGLYLADVFGAGSTTLLVTMKPAGLLDPVKPLLILPEVIEPNNWRGGNLPIADKDGTTFRMIGELIRTVIYNSDLIREGEITSYRDLLKPQYKGKITMNDPTVSGGGAAVISHLAYNLWGEEKTADLLRQLIKQQEMVIYRDNRLHVESVARGKYAFGIAPLSELAAEFRNLGAPIKSAIVEEDNRITSGAGALGVPVKFAHTNAATIFVNWLLSKEGQAVFIKGFGSPSNRLDVSTEGINPLLIPEQGKKYFADTEEQTLVRGKAMELAKKVIEEAMK